MFICKENKNILEFRSINRIFESVEKKKFVYLNEKMKFKFDDNYFENRINGLTFVVW